VLFDFPKEHKFFLEGFHASRICPSVKSSFEDEVERVVMVELFWDKEPNYLEEKSSTTNPS